MHESDYFLDSVVLSNFALTNSLNLLAERYGAKACLTSEVLDEVAHGVTCGYENLRTVIEYVVQNRFSTTALQPQERTQYTELLRTLGAGEASCIACAHLRNGVVITDDKAARSCCKDLKVRFTGTIGVLVAMCEDAQLSSEKADNLLAMMVEQGFFSPVSSISALL